MNTDDDDADDYLGGRRDEIYRQYGRRVPQRQRGEPPDSRCDGTTR